MKLSIEIFSNRIVIQVYSCEKVHHQMVIILRWFLGQSNTYNATYSLDKRQIPWTSENWIFVNYYD